MQRTSYPIPVAVDTIEFAGLNGLRVRIIYYLSYHSKLNAVERYWAGLEKSWNGYLLDTVETVLKRGGNFVWKGLRTVTRLLDAPYEKGVKVCGDEKTDLEKRLHRSTIVKIRPRRGQHWVKPKGHGILDSLVISNDLEQPES